MFEFSLQYWSDPTTADQVTKTDQDTQTTILPLPICPNLPIWSDYQGWYIFILEVKLYFQMNCAMVKRVYQILTLRLLQCNVTSWYLLWCKYLISWSYMKQWGHRSSVSFFLAKSLVGFSKSFSLSLRFLSSSSSNSLSQSSKPPGSSMISSSIEWWNI